MNYDTSTIILLMNVEPHWMNVLDLIELYAYKILKRQIGRRGKVLLREYISTSYEDKSR